MPGDAVRGVVIAVDRTLAVVQIGPYRARVGPAEIASSGKKVVAEALPAGAIAPFLIQAIDGKEIKVSLEQEPKVEGALIAVEPRSGAVRAMVGGYDFERSKFNRATQAWRQVGSAFKPIIYSAALERAGYTPSTLIVDSPVTFPDNQGDLEPAQLRLHLLGPHPAAARHRAEPEHPRHQDTPHHRASRRASNTPRSWASPPSCRPTCRWPSAPATPPRRRWSSAFATFANQGLRMKPSYIARITDRDGNVIEEPRPVAKDAIRADTAYIMTSLLKGVVERGTAARARSLKRPIAGKTGHHQRLHRRLVRGLRAVAGLRGVGGLRREEGQPGPRAPTARARRCPSGWSSGPRP